MKILKVVSPYDVKNNNDLKYWVRVVGSYIGFKNEQEYLNWIKEVDTVREVVAYK